MPEIHLVDQKTKERMGKLEQTVAFASKLSMLVSNPATRSHTVLAIAGREEFIASVKKDAEKQNIQLGSGYGPLKPTSFRIANFPAITDEEFEKLLTFLKAY